MKQVSIGESGLPEADVLEYSSIAWPNSSMWSKEPRLFKYNAGSGASDIKEAEDAHTHSPTRHDIRTQALGTRQFGEQLDNIPARSIWRDRNYQGPVPQWQGNLREPRLAPPETVFADPFIDPYVLDSAARQRGARQSLEDISMPDYSSSAGSRAISNMTGISYEHSKHPSLVAPMDEEAYSQLIQALSPPKPLAYSTQAPASTAATSAMPMGAKLSAAAEARSASYGKGGSRRPSVSVLKDVSYPSTRNASGSSVKSGTAPPDGNTERGTAKLHPSPSGPIKSRKEGLSIENKENEAEARRRESDQTHQTPTKPQLRTSGSIDTPTEGKRRRSVGSDCLNINMKEPVLFSPTQGPSKTKDDLQQSELDSLLDSRPKRMNAAVSEAGEIN